MGMNFVRTGVSAGIGVASGAIAAQGTAIPPIALPGLGNVSVDAIVEGVAGIGGAALQLLAPMTLPSVVDGLVDGGLALLGRRVTFHALKPGTPYPMQRSGNGAWTNAWQANAAGARYGNVHGASRGNIYTQGGIATVQVN